MPCCCRADAEDLNSQNEAELRRQVEEEQQETEHAYELLENKIQLLQEVRGGHGPTEARASGPQSPFRATPSVLACLFSFASLVYQMSLCLRAPNLGGAYNYHPAYLPFFFFFQESRLAKNEATRMETVVEAEKGCDLELSERQKDAARNREDALGDQVKPSQYSEALAQRDR